MQENNNQGKTLGNELQIRREKLSALQAAGNDPFQLTKFPVDTLSGEIFADYERYEGKTVTLGGRMVSRRVMGKASFMHILDNGGKIQVYVKRDGVGEDAYAAFKKWDIGDILGIEVI